MTSDYQWTHIHADIVDASRVIAETGKYDDAIFAAFRLVEAAIQERIGSSQIGESLVAAAFGSVPPLINISSDGRDQHGIQSLFSGALCNIRNDRGHKKKPVTPCGSMADCILYLAFASFLLLLLSKDRNLFPRIETIRVMGTAKEPRAEIRGINFKGSDITVRAAANETSIVRSEPDAIEILLPEHFYGNVTICVDGRNSNEMFCDASAVGERPENYYEVFAAELSLYTDSTAQSKRPNLVGLLIRANDGCRDIMRIVPTYPNTYVAGTYITHGPHERDSRVDETWYRDPVTGLLEYAWTSSMIMTPQMLGPVGAPKIGGISILPAAVQTQLGENRCLRVLAWARDGSVQKTSDVTDRVKWKNGDNPAAFVKNGVVIPKKLGRVRAECELDGFVGAVDISIENPFGGQRARYFQGLRNLRQIRFDGDDGLYICNQGPSVFRLDRSGAFSEVIRIPMVPTAPAGIDCLAVDEHKNIYLNNACKHTAFKFLWGGKAYANPAEIAVKVKGAKKGLAVGKSGDAFVAVMGPPGRGWIVRRESDGTETSFPVDGMPMQIATGPDGNVYVPIATRATILVFQPNGTLVEEIPFGIKESISDIQIAKDGAIYMAFIQTGRILRIGFTKPLWHAEFLSHPFGNPGGVALDSHQRLYVADGAGDSIDVVY